MVSMGMLNLLLSRYLFSPYVTSLFNADIRTQRVGDLRFHVSSWNRDLLTDRDQRKCTELARAGSSALLSPSTLPLIKTMSSFHLSTKIANKLCVIILCCTAAHTSPTRPRSAALRKASVTHLPAGISNHTVVPFIYVQLSRKGMEKTSQ